MRKYIPNALSCSRIIFAALFLVIYDPEKKLSYVLAVGILILGFGTDAIDGLLARRWRVTSEQGYILDGIGDRAMYISSTLTLVATNRLAASLAWLIVLRELLLYAVRSLPETSWYPVPMGERILTKTHALAIRVFFFSCFLADGLRLYTGINSYALISFRLIKGVLLTVALLVAYYALGSLLRRSWMRTAREDMGNRDRSRS
jgi:phosphatidylglycerophosphate synthase